jgi:hypothetical protein
MAFGGPDEGVDLFIMSVDLVLVTFRGPDEGIDLFIMSADLVLVTFGGPDEGVDLFSLAFGAPYQAVNSASLRRCD